MIWNKCIACEWIEFGDHEFLDGDPWLKLFCKKIEEP